MRWLVQGHKAKSPLAVEPGLWGACCFFHTPLSLLCFSHTDAQNCIYDRELRGWHGCDGPVCVCNGARVGGCEGGWAERLPWHSALGVGLPHTQGRGRGGGDVTRLWGGASCLEDPSWGAVVCTGGPRGTLRGWPQAPLLQPLSSLWYTRSPFGFPVRPWGGHWPLGSCVCLSSVDGPFRLLILHRS